MVSIRRCHLLSLRALAQRDESTANIVSHSISEYDIPTEIVYFLRVENFEVEEPCTTAFPIDDRPGAKFNIREFRIIRWFSMMSGRMGVLTSMAQVSSS